MKNLTLLLLLSCRLICIGQNATDDWKTLKKEEYQIEYPPNWELDQSGNWGTAFILFGRNATEAKFRENVNLGIQDLSGMDVNLDKFVQISEQQITGNAKLVESKRIKGKPLEYHQIIFEGDHGGFKLKWKQYYWVLNDKAYILTFTGSQDAYDEFIETVDGILNSFRIGKN